MKVTVKIKPEIAKKGSGFSDIEGKQEIRPFDKNGKLVPDKVFELESTPFVELKISTGELKLLKREEDQEEKKTKTDPGAAAEVELKVFVNGESKGMIKTEKDASEGKIKRALFADESIRASLEDVKIKDIKITESEVEITAK